MHHVNQDSFSGLLNPPSLSHGASASLLYNNIDDDDGDNNTTNYNDDSYELINCLRDGKSKIKTILYVPV